jgi:hypothetical protein
MVGAVQKKGRENHAVDRIIWIRERQDAYRSIVPTTVI